MKKIFTLLTVLGLSVMGLNAQQVWTGATSSDWNDATNWLAGAVPPDTGRIQIPTTYLGLVGGLPGNIQLPIFQP